MICARVNALPRRAGEHLENAELLGGQGDRPAADPYLEPAGVDLQLADP
jgi:hypothetical protein